MGPCTSERNDNGGSGLRKDERADVHDGAEAAPEPARLAIVDALPLDRRRGHYAAVRMGHNDDLAALVEERHDDVVDHRHVDTPGVIHGPRADRRGELRRVYFVASRF